MEALDDIINAISEILLVFEKAQSSFATNIIIKAEAVVRLLKEVDIMVQGRESTARQITDTVLRQRMLDSNKHIHDATARLVSIVNSQPNGIVQRTAYSSLHDELRVILQNMVEQVKITDQVNVGIIMGDLRRWVDVLQRMRESTIPTSFEAIIPEADKFSRQLQISLRTRVAEVTDPDLQRRLMTATDSLQTSLNDIYSVCRNNSSAQVKEQTFAKVLRTTSEAVTVIQLSAKYVSDYLMAFAMPDLTAKEAEEPAPFSVNRAPQVNLQLARLEDAVKRDDTPTAVAASKAFTQDAMRQAALARNLADRIEGPAKQALLKDAALLEQMVPKVVQATKAALETKGDKEKAELYKLIKETREINNRIEEAKKLEKAMLDAAARLAAMFDELLKACDNNDKDTAIKVVKDLAEEMKAQVAQARATARAANDPAIRAELERLANELEKLIPEIVAATKAVLENPNDAAARARLEALTAKANQIRAQITQAALEDSLAVNKKDIANNLEGLKNAIAKKDEREAGMAVKDTIDKVNRHIEMGQALSATTQDPLMKQQINRSVAELQKLNPQLFVATKEAMANPDSVEARGKLNDVIDKINNATEKVTAQKLFPQGPASAEAIDETANAIFANSANLDKAIDRLDGAVKSGNKAEAADALKDVAFNIKKQIALGRQLASQCKDPVLQKEINNACDELERLLPQILEATKAALANPKDAAAQKRLQELLAKAKAASNIINDAAQKMHSKQGGSFIGRRPSEKPMDEFKADGSRDAIMVAAHSVANATRSAAVPVLAEQKSILDISASISKEMELLALAAQKGNKAEMIEIAKKIAGMIVKIQDLANEIAKKCKNEILKEQLMSVARVPKNFSTQLKIIAAVKATSAANDPTAEAQLVTCAQGLAQSVVRTLQAAESASIASVDKKK